MNTHNLHDKTLLLVVSWFPHKGSSTSSPFIFSQINEIKNYFKKVVVISLNPFVPKFLQNPSFKKVFNAFGLSERWHNDIFSGHYCKDYKFSNVEVHFIPYFTLPFLWPWKYSGEVMLKNTLHAIKQKKIYFDLIHAHLE